MADVEAVRILEYRLQQAGQPQNPCFSLVIFVHRTEWKCSSLGTVIDWLASEELRQEFMKMDCNRKNPKTLSAIAWSDLWTAKNEMLIARDSVPAFLNF